MSNDGCIGSRELRNATKNAVRARLFVPDRTSKVNKTKMAKCFSTPPPSSPHQHPSSTAERNLTRNFIYLFIFRYSRRLNMLGSPSVRVCRGRWNSVLLFFLCCCWLARILPPNDLISERQRRRLLLMLTLMLLLLLMVRQVAE